MSKPGSSEQHNQIDDQASEELEFDEITILPLDDQADEVNELATDHQVAIDDQSSIEQVEQTDLAKSSSESSTDLASSTVSSKLESPQSTTGFSDFTRNLSYKPVVINDDSNAQATKQTSRTDETDDLKLGVQVLIDEIDQTQINPTQALHTTTIRSGDMEFIITRLGGPIDAETPLPIDLSQKQILITSLLLVLAIVAGILLNLTQPRLELSAPTANEHLDADQLHFKWQTNETKCLFVMEVTDEDGVALRLFSNDPDYVPSLKEKAALHANHDYQWRLFISFDDGTTFKYHSEAIPFHIDHAASLSQPAKK